MDLSFIPNASSLKILGFFVTTPLLILASWVKFKHGNFSLSQSRTQRLYDLMLTKPNWDEVQSGVLQLAVESALNVELAGDKIRYAMRRDRPLAVLQALKLTRRLIKLAPDGQNLMDARKHPIWSFRTQALVSGFLLFVVYGITMVMVHLIGNARPDVLLLLFGLQLSTSAFLTVNTTRSVAAHYLLTPDFFRLPGVQERRS